MTSLAGLGRVVRLVLRLDRVRLPIWVLGLGASLLVSASSLPPLYPDQASIDTYARLFGDNPALIAMAGPGHGFDNPNIGVILVNETQLFGCIGMALMSIFLVNRHTRAEEDVERTEVLRSSVVGRHAPVAAAMAVVAAANVLIAVLCLVGFVVMDYPIAGSVALSLSFATCGLVFTGLAGVTAQVAGGSRASLGLASAVLGLSFVLRALGDIGENGLVWLSPIGWSQAVQAYAHERWWTLGLGVVVAVCLASAAFWLSTVRDLGAGLVPQRPGPAGASRWLPSPLGLAVRLQRGFLAGWMVAAFSFGVVYGSIGRDIEQMIAENPVFADFLAQLQGASLTDSYLATSLSVLSLIAGGYVTASVLRLRSEEAQGRAEPILVASVGRVRWARSHLVVATLGSVLVMASAGLGMGLSYAVVSSDAGQIPRLVGASLVTVPAILVFGAVAFVGFGWVPRQSASIAWTVLTVSVLLAMFAELLRLPEWMRDVSPTQHVPAVPAQAFDAVPLVVLGALVGVLTAAGLVGLGRRDVRAT